MKKVYALVLMSVMLASECFGEFREVQFGKYYRDSEELSPITWLVLYEDSDSLLLITKYCIDSIPYNETRATVTWEACTLRQWLNGEFLHTAFTSQEQEAISRSVFLLSLDDAVKYMPNDSDRRCSPTSYAISRGAYTNGEGLCAWWTSSPGRTPTQAAYFSSYGTIGNRPHYVDEGIIGVRPAVRVNRNAFDGAWVFSVKPTHEKARIVETRIQPLVEQSAPFEVKALYEYFLTESRKALREFDMKRLTVEGVVLRKGPDGVFGQPSIELTDSAGGKCYVLCVFENAGDYSGVKVGEKICVRGNYLVIREDYEIVLKPCEITEGK
ncbi:MAG: hypothetical protein IJS28_06065 [Synergistaceae bacterium]|nr:hypothetical protein [Synergistaceae bacterium]